MKIVKYLVNGVTAVALACSFAACGDDDEDPDGGEGGNGDDPGWVEPTPGTDPVLTDEEAKEYLEQTANIVMDKFNPVDQQPLVELAGDFCKDYAGYGLEGFDDDDDEEEYYPSQARKGHDSRGLVSFFRHIRQAMASGDYMSVSRAAADVIRFSDFTGIYEPDAESEMFRLKGVSSDLVVNFRHAGNPCQMIVSPVGNGTWSMDLSQLTEGEFASAEVPDNICFSLTEAGRDLISGSVESRWNATSLKVVADVTITNIRVTANVNGTGSVITSQEALYVDGNLLQTSEAKVNGTGMVDPQRIASLFDVETYRYEYAPGMFYEESYYEFNEYRAADMFRSGEANTVLLGRMKVATTIADSKKLTGIETYFDSYDYDGDENKAKKDCQFACDSLNTGAPVHLYLAGASTATAQLKWQPRFKDYGYYNDWYWEPEAIIRFADGSSYSVEDYATNGFASLQTRFSSLTGAYIGLWNAAFK